jgi:restriction endonuclease S subunit
MDFKNLDEYYEYLENDTNFQYLDLNTYKYITALRDNNSFTIFKELVIGLPSIKEQKVIVQKVETLMQKCNALEQEITQSEQHANMLIQAVLKEAFEK